MSNHQESFTVLSITREDVAHAMGYNLGAELDDQEMDTLASKLTDALMTLDPWDILAGVIESWLEIKKESLNEYQEHRK